MENEEFDFESVYQELSEKHGLPEFKSLAEDFDIEKISEKESMFLLREIRRTISEKISAYAHLFETLINPSSPPMFIFTALRGIENGEKEKIKGIYKRLSRIQIEVMKLDTIYSEVSEASFVKKSFSEWQELKKEVFNIIEKLEENFEKEDDTKKRGYFG